MLNRVKILGVAVVLALAAGACGDLFNEETSSSTQQDEADRLSNAYDTLVSEQPAYVPEFSPTRETINRWLEYWDEPGKLSFYYLGDGNGNYEYYIFEGLPVSYCASNTETEEVVSSGGSGRAMVTKTRPAMDGAYYRPGCTSFQTYGFEAVTGDYVEFSVGGYQFYHLRGEPLLEHPDDAIRNAEPGGSITYDDVDLDGLD